jgi:hypothetical protein
VDTQGGSEGSIQRSVTEGDGGIQRMEGVMTAVSGVQEGRELWSLQDTGERWQFPRYKRNVLRAFLGHTTDLFLEAFGVSGNYRI